MSVEEMCLEPYLIPCKSNGTDGYLGNTNDLLHHAKASLSIARVLSQLLFMVNTDEELDHEALLTAAIACVEDEVLVKMLFPLVKSKNLLDVLIVIREGYFSSEQALKEKIDAHVSQMLKLERERYDQLAEMEPLPDARIFNRLYIESWYYTEEDEALLHLKLDHFLSKCDIIKEDSTLDGVLGKLDLPEDFTSIPVALLKTAILRRIYRLKKLASIEPYKKFLREVISKLVGEGGKSFDQFKFFLTFLDYKPSHFLDGRDKDPFLGELCELAEKYSLGEYILGGSLDHCRTILIMSNSAGEIDEALEEFVEKLKREVERKWFADQAKCPAYFAALRKLQLEMEMRGESLNQDEEDADEEVADEEDADEEVTEVLPISSSYVFSLEDFTWVWNLVFDTLHNDEKRRPVNYLKFRHWESALREIDSNRRGVDLLHKELLEKISASCLFFFEILRGMPLPQLMNVFQKISQGKDVEMKFVHVDKKLKEMDLADIVLNELEKFEENVHARPWAADNSKFEDDWQAIDLNPNWNLGQELVDLAKAFRSATEHLKGHKNTASQFKYQSRLDFVKETLQGYQDSYLRECRLREDIARMTEQKDAASDVLGDLHYVKGVHDSIEKAAKGELVLKEKSGTYCCDTVHWWIYRRLDQAKLEQDTSMELT